MAQQVTLRVVSISNDILDTSTFSITVSEGTVFPTTCTKAELVEGLVINITSDTVDRVTVTNTSGPCSGIAQDIPTWTIVAASPTPTPTGTPTSTPPGETQPVTPTPTGTPTSTPPGDTQPVTPTPTNTPTNTPGGTPPVTPSNTPPSTPDGTPPVTPSNTPDPVAPAPTATETPTPTPTTSPAAPAYNYYTVRGCPNTFYEGQDMRIRTLSTLNVTGDPSTSEGISWNGQSFYSYATIDAITWQTNADLASITYSGAITFCPSVPSQTPTQTPTSTPQPTVYTYNTRYDASSELTACESGVLTTLYSTCSVITAPNGGGQCRLYTNAGLTNEAPNGYYADIDNGNYYYIEGGAIVQEVLSCPAPPPTATPTPTPVPANCTQWFGTAGFATDSTACSNAGAGTRRRHNGSGPYPEIGDTIFTGADCTTTLLGQDLWYYVDVDTAAIQVNDSGLVTDKSYC